MVTRYEIVHPNVRCVRRKRNGEQCKRIAMRYATTCFAHDGSAPQIQKAARQRFLELVDPAIAVLDDCMADPTASWADRVRAAALVLASNGYGPTSKVEVTRKTDLHPKIIDMLNAPPALSATAQSAVTSITTLPAVNRKPRAKPQPK